MKIAPRHEATVDRKFEQQYAFHLREYASGSGESALVQAYELGRLAITERKSLMEVAALHHQALKGLMDDERNKQQREDLLRSSAEFLGECLSLYEISHRGSQDAAKALRQINETLEEEIKSIAYAVHDEAGQLLVAVHLALAEMARELPKAQQDQIGRMEELLVEVEKQLRRYSHELRPTILDDLGWIPAIRFLADRVSQRASLAIDIQVKDSGRLPSEMETTLYRITQEALNNIAKHAQAKNVWIRAWQEDQVLRCSIRDDGEGFDARNTQEAGGRQGLGLVAMRERASAIGGTLSIESYPGQGTELSLRLPLESSHVNSSFARG
jgi:signal transduction histidine kinase